MLKQETQLTFWKYREELSQTDRIRRSYYELLRDELDQFLLQYALIDSYQNFLSQQVPFPFVEKRELKPRARIPDQEYGSQNAFLIIFVEDIVPNEHKKYIRFFDDNKTAKANLMRFKTLALSQKFDRNAKYLESIHFNNLDRDAVLLPRGEVDAFYRAWGLFTEQVRLASSLTPTLEIPQPSRWKELCALREESKRRG